MVANFVDVSKDEMFEFDVKTRQHIFIGYGDNELDYKLYDVVEKKLVRSRECIPIKYFYLLKHF
ncbi:hypothetical protein CR513_53939, partial [Mucuna pruriens]